MEVPLLLYWKINTLANLSIKFLALLSETAKDYIVHSFILVKILLLGNYNFYFNFISIFVKILTSNICLMFVCEENPQLIFLFMHNQKEYYTLNLDKLGKQDWKIKR